jgi:hypothetical protein
LGAGGGGPAGGRGMERGEREREEFVHEVETNYVPTYYCTTIPTYYASMYHRTA